MSTKKNPMLLSVDGYKNVTYGNYVNNPHVTVMLVRKNLDEWAQNDIKRNRGFRITTNQGPKKDIYSPTSIYSPKYGETVYGENPYVTKYKCTCGKTVGSKYENTVCPKCKTIVKYIGEDFTYFGWIILDKYKVIHPVYYNQLRSFIGNKYFDNIIKIIVNKDKDGIVVPNTQEDIPANEPFYGIGLIEFRRRFSEIMLYYKNKNKSKPNKMDLYYDIMNNSQDVFTGSIPVYTVHLRPIKISDNKKVFEYDGLNNKYSILARNAQILNKGTHERNITRTLEMLHNIQTIFMDLYDMILNTMKGKKGEFRNIFGGRYNFTARAIIKPRPSRVDEIELPFVALLELLQQTIVNTLVKTGIYTPNQAYMVWLKASTSEESLEKRTVVNIINDIIRTSERGIPVILNRNPTIEFGSIQQMYVTGFNFGYAIGIPLQILEFFGADFDGDAMNVHYIINEAYRREAERIFNPRNAFYVSHEDGYLNTSIVHNKDLLVNMNSLRTMVDYNEEQYNAILRFKEKYNIA